MPADSLAPGAIPAQEVSRAGLAKIDMSMPIPAMMRSAVRVATPGIVTSRSRVLPAASVEDEGVVFGEDVLR